MFFFDVNETSDEIIYQLRHGIVLFLAILCSFLLSLFYLFLLEMLTPILAVIVYVLPLVVLIVFFIDVFKLLTEIRREKKKGCVLHSSRHLISLENQWVITLKKSKKNV